MQSVSRVILRDVPKSVTLNDVAKTFPDATLFIMYEATFPASEYWY